MGSGQGVGRTQCRCWLGSSPRSQVVAIGEGSDQAPQGELRGGDAERSQIGEAKRAQARAAQGNRKSSGRGTGGRQVKPQEELGLGAIRRAQAKPLREFKLRPGSSSQAEHSHHIRPRADHRAACPSSHRVPHPRQGPHSRAKHPPRCAAE